MQYDSFEELLANDPVAAINLLNKMSEAQKDGEHIANVQATELGYPQAETHTLSESEQKDLAIKVMNAIHKDAKTRFDSETWQTALMLTMPLLMRHYVPKVADGKGDYDIDIRTHATVLEAALIIAMTLSESAKMLKAAVEEYASEYDDDDYDDDDIDEEEHADELDRILKQLMSLSIK